MAVAQQTKSRVKKPSARKPEPRPEPLSVVPEGMQWMSNQQINKGDILRTIVKNPGHALYGQYFYTVATGGGFGCNPSALGNAIFTHDDGSDLNVVMSHAKDVYQESKPEYDEDGKQIIRLFKLPSEEDPRLPGHYRSCDGNRWERFWGVDVLRPA
jgi:hypothetical protein